jgi:hypothetical protein
MNKFLTEFIGAFFFVATIGFTVVNRSDPGLIAPLAIGSVLMVMIMDRQWRGKKALSMPAQATTEFELVFKHSVATFHYVYVAATAPMLISLMYVSSWRVANRSAIVASTHSTTPEKIDNP